MVVIMKKTKTIIHRTQAASGRRRVILIDIENFNGGPISSSAQAHWCRRVIENWVRLEPGEQVIIASDVTGVIDIQLAWGGARILAGRSKDGADLRLLEVMDEDLPARFSEMVLISGDHIYADKVSALAEVGLPTHVFAHSAVLSKRLNLAATTVTTVIEPTPTVGKAA